MSKVLASVKAILREIKNSLLVGDAGVLFLVSGLGLFFSGVFGCFFVNTINGSGFDIAPIWHISYIVIGVLLWLMVGLKFPALPSLIIGGGLTILSAWLTLSKLVYLGDHIDVASGIVYAIVGLLLVQRSARN
jgi:hypothetical protein